MNEQQIHDKLFQHCADTLQTIENREATTVRPKTFVEHTDAAACNQQDDRHFDQEAIIKRAILSWGRNILQHVSIGQSMKISKLLGHYLNIHVELPTNGNQMKPLKYAMLEVIDLFEKGYLTMPVATRILIAGLQQTLYDTEIYDDRDIKQLLLQLTQVISDIRLPYARVQLPLTQ